MHIERIGFTPLKGARHLSHEEVRLTAEGPEGDRALCLVDPARRRVVRTVENPTLVRTMARWDGGVLAVDLPAGTVAGVPGPTGNVVSLDYWGRTAHVELLDGPWSEAYSEFLGYEVRLGRPVRTGAIVYGASVAVVTTSSMRHLADRVGAPVDSARFRSTFLLDDEGDGPHVEDGWVGRELRLGAATVRVRGVVPRCAVVDIDPVTAERSVPVLKTLGGYRRGEGEIYFGVDAVVVRPGVVRAGDVAALERG